MKSIFNLAIITKEGQSIEELLRPYMVNDKEDASLEERIKEKRNFISGVILGDIDEDYADNHKLLIKDEKQELIRTSSALIRELRWKEMIDEVNKELEDMEEDYIVDENNFIFTEALITPDKKWHGMMPQNVLEIGYENEDAYNEYKKSYYKKYINDYKDEGKITVVTCTF